VLDRSGISVAPPGHIAVAAAAAALPTLPGNTKIPMNMPRTRMSTKMKDAKKTKKTKTTKTKTMKTKTTQTKTTQTMKMNTMKMNRVKMNTMKRMKMRMTKTKTMKTPTKTKAMNPKTTQPVMMKSKTTTQHLPHRGHQLKHQLGMMPAPVGTTGTTTLLPTPYTLRLQTMTSVVPPSTHHMLKTTAMRT